ncbi:MAG: anthranilate phosphoribosyltransferase [Acidimicrobiales bacterium]
MTDQAAGTLPAGIESVGGWPGVFSRLFRRDNLSVDEAAAALGSVLAGEASPVQVSALLSALRTKGETVEEMTGLVRAMQAHAEPLVIAGDLVDTCGTGGDRSGTINVSTISALVVAGAGAKVCKHGNRAASSIAGSADVFEALGVVIDLGPAGVSACVEDAGIGFCLATRYHPAMRHAAPVRRELGVATVFNFLGPLANPARATRQLVGVGDRSMAEKMLAVLEANGTVHAMVVFGHDGLDELTTVTTSTVLETVRVSDDDDGPAYERRTYDVDPEALDLPLARLEDLRGGAAALNAELAGAVLSGERGPRRDFVLLNAAAALVVAGLAPALQPGIELAGSVLDSGAAAAALERLVASSRRAAGDA